MGLLLALRRPAPLHGVATLLTATRTTGVERRPRPTAADRARDAFALALLVGGAATFFYARYRLQELGANRFTRVPGHWAVEQFMHYYQMSRVALWVAGAGLIAALASALLRAARSRRAAPPPISSHDP